MFTNLKELIQSMPDEKTCREYLIQQRWDGRPICPYCGCGKTYVIEGGKRFKCGSKECYKKFSATVGTIFEASNISLINWFTAIYLVTAHKKGISSYQLGRDIGVTQKTAWFMLHRIRELMRPKVATKLDNIVEIDECYVGGKVGNMSKKRRAALRTANNGTAKNKTMVLGMIERGGELKLMALPEKDNSTDILQPLVKDNVDNGAVLITDGLSSYVGLGNDYAGHEVVNHSADEYVRPGGFHTNSIEGAFSLLKRSIIGIYHQVTPKHLSRYCDETMYRYNSRKLKDADRFTLSLKRSEGRLTYKDLVARIEPVQNVDTDYPEYIAGNGKPVYQLKDGIVIQRYESIKQASKVTGLDNSTIRKVLKGINKTTGGFGWKYA